jgi:hypothetical protein
LVFHANGTMVKQVVGYDEQGGRKELENAIALAFKPE